MEDTDNTPVVRINGALMANYLQSKAIIVGYVTKVPKQFFPILNCFLIHLSLRLIQMANVPH